MPKKKDAGGFPMIQKPNSFTIDDAVAMMKEAAGGAGK